MLASPPQWQILQKSTRLSVDAAVVKLSDRKESRSASYWAGERSARPLLALDMRSASALACPGRVSVTREVEGFLDSVGVTKDFKAPPTGLA